MPTPAPRRAPGLAGLALAASLALGACASVHVERDFDPDIDFASFRAYAWRGPVEGCEDLANDPFLAKRVREAVDEAFAARGIVHSESEPDFTIGWCAAIRQRVDVSTVDQFWGYRGRRGWPRWSTSTWVTTYDEGTLVLDVADARTGQPAWRGTARQIVDHDGSPEEHTERVRDAVAALLEEFPPGRKAR